MSERFDLVVRHARVATAGDQFDCDLGIVDGRIAAMAAWLPAGCAAREIDAAGRFVTPGGVDAHCRWLCWQIVHLPPAPPYNGWRRVIRP